MRIAPLLPPVGTIKIVDVGAMMFADAEHAYARLREATSCQVIGFEPVIEECEKLNQRKLPGDLYLPYAIGDGSTRLFYECNFPMTSSLLEPNTELLEQFHKLADVSRPVRQSMVETRRLDDIAETAGVDFLKLDVQGAELLVLQGAEARLRDSLVVHTEVEFVPLYKNQPLFGDIDIFLRERGFLLHRITHESRTFKPVIFNDDPFGPGSQPLWGDAVYVRDFMRLDAIPAEKLLKLAVILHENYNSVDFATFVLRVYDRTAGTNVRSAYMQGLAGTA